MPIIYENEEQQRQDNAPVQAENQENSVDAIDWDALYDEAEGADTNTDIDTNTKEPSKPKKGVEGFIDVSTNGTPIERNGTHLNPLPAQPQRPLFAQFPNDEVPLAPGIPDTGKRFDPQRPQIGSKVPGQGIPYNQSADQQDTPTPVGTAYDGAANVFTEDQLGLDQEEPKEERSFLKDFFSIDNNVQAVKNFFSPKNNLQYLKNFGNAVVSSGISALSNIGAGYEEQAIGLGKAIRNFSDNPGWQKYWDKQIKGSEENLSAARRFGEKAKPLTGAPGEFLGSMTPFVATAAVSIMLKNPYIATGTSVGFGEMGYGEGIKSYDDYKKQTGQPIDEEERAGAGALYAVAYTAPIANYLGKMMPKNLIARAVQGAMVANPEATAVMGREIFDNFARKSPTLAKQLMNNIAKGAGHGVASMEVMSLSKMAVDDYLIGKDVSAKDYWNTIQESAASGLVFGALTAPFATIAQNQATQARRLQQGYVTLTKDSAGKPVEIIIDKNGNNIGLTPSGKQVKLTQEQIDNSFTLTTEDFNSAISTYGLTKQTPADIERTAYLGRTSKMLDRVSDENGMVTVPLDPNTDILAVLGRKEGKLIGVSKAGEVIEIDDIPVVNVNKGMIWSTLRDAYDKEHATPQEKYEARKAFESADTPEAKQEAQEKVDAFDNVARQQAQEAANDARNEVANKTNNDTNTIITATHMDGSIVDVIGGIPSDPNSIITVRTEDGTTKQVSSKELTDIQEADPAQLSTELSQQAYDDVLNRHAEEMAYSPDNNPQPGQSIVINGVPLTIQSIDPTSGMTTLVDEKGQPAQLTFDQVRDAVQDQIELQDKAGAIIGTKFDVDGAVGEVTGLTPDGSRVVYELESGEMGTMSMDFFNDIKAKQDELAKAGTQETATEPVPTAPVEPDATGGQSVPMSESAPLPAETAPVQPRENLFPKDKQGNIDYKQIPDPQMYAEALQAEFGQDAAIVVSEMEKDAKAAIKKAATKSNAIERLRAMKQAQAELDRVNTIKNIITPQKPTINEYGQDISTQEQQGEAPAQTTTTAGQSQAGEIQATGNDTQAVTKKQRKPSLLHLDPNHLTPTQKRSRDLGEFLDLDDYLLRSIAEGQKFLWKSTDGRKGLDTELGMRSETERRKRISITNNAYGITPEEWAEYIDTELRPTGTIPLADMDQNDIRGRIIDIASSLHSPTQAINQAESRHQSSIEREKAYYENQDAIVEKLEKAERDLRDEVFAQQMAELSELTDDERIEFENLFNDEINNTFDGNNNAEDGIYVPTDTTGSGTDSTIDDQGTAGRGIEDGTPVDNSQLGAETDQGTGIRDSQEDTPSELQHGDLQPENGQIPGSEADVVESDARGTEQTVDLTASKEAKPLPKTVRELAEMDPESGYISSVVLSSINEGDTFKVGRNTTYTVTKKSKSTKKSYDTGKYSGQYSTVSVTLTDDKGAKYSFELRSDWMQNGKRMVSQLIGKGSSRKSDPVAGLSRDIEADITIDLINEYNRFHDKSDSFRIIEKELNRINAGQKGEDTMVDTSSPKVDSKVDTLTPKSKEERKAAKAAEADIDAQIKSKKAEIKRLEEDREVERKRIIKEQIETNQMDVFKAAKAISELDTKKDFSDKNLQRIFDESDLEISGAKSDLERLEALKPKLISDAIQAARTTVDMFGGEGIIEKPEPEKKEPAKKEVLPVNEGLFAKPVEAESTDSIDDIEGNFLLDRLEEKFKEQYGKDEPFNRSEFVKTWNNTKESRDVNRANSNLLELALGFFHEDNRLQVFQSWKKQIDKLKAIAKAESEVNTDPTEGQKEAGNYPKGHVRIQGMDITIETAKGTTRSGKDESGKPWSINMQNSYGYFLRTVGFDKDHIDVFLGENPTSETVFVVDQNKPDGSFDESKVMLGFDSAEQAKDAYMSNHEEGWQGFGSITAIPVDDFKKWLYDGARQRKPFAEYADIKSNQQLADSENKNNFAQNDSNDGKTSQTGLDNSPAVGGESERLSLGTITTSPEVQRTIEACYTPASDRSGKAKQAGSWRKSETLQRLSEKAKENGSWIDKETTSLVDWKNNFSAGTENDVYLSSDGMSVIKFNNFGFLNPDDSQYEFTRDFNYFIDRIIAHNILFPDVALNIIGFDENAIGDVCIIMEQPYIKGTFPTQEELDETLKSMGFTHGVLGKGVNEGLNGWTNGIYEITDAKPANVIKDENGVLHFIDLDISPVIKTSESSPKLETSETEKIEKFSENGNEPSVSVDDSENSSPKSETTNQEDAPKKKTPDVEIKQFPHSKTGETMHVVTLPTRVSPSEYSEINSIAKSLGGRYSSYNKQGAIAGFLFKSEEKANEFKDALTARNLPIENNLPKDVENQQNSTNFVNKESDNGKQGLLQGNRKRLPRTESPDLFSGIDSEQRTGGNSGLSGESLPGTDAAQQQPAGRKGTVLSGDADVLKPALVTFNAEDNDTQSFNPSRKYDDNIAAIETLLRIINENRRATSEEKDILSKYVGFGGLKDVLLNPETTEGWKESNLKYRDQVRRVVELAQEFDKSTGTTGSLGSIKGSILNAHFTSSSVIRSIYDGLAKLGFKGGRILEPSAGIGNFITFMPESIKEKSNFTAVELDNLTGNILKYLHDEANVKVSGIQDAGIPNNSQDLVISNVPFGNYKVFDKAFKGEKAEFQNRIHNYFFAKALDLAREGGIIAFVTSKGVLDAPGNEALRRYINENAEFLGAVRLPESAFKNNANTEVVADIIFLRKNTTEPKKNPDFITVKKFTAIHKDGEMQDVNINNYFLENANNILGPIVAGGQYSRDDYTVVNKTGYDLTDAIKKILPSGIYEKTKSGIGLQANDSQETIDSIKEGNIELTGGRLVRKEEGQLNTISINESEPKIQHYIRLRNALMNLIYSEYLGKSDNDIEALRKQLNLEYDTFTKKYGKLSKNAAKIAKMDADGFNVLSLEVSGKKDGKADIFRQRTIQPIQNKQTADNIDEAIVISLYENAAIDIERIAELLNKPIQEVISEAKGKIFELPTGGFVTREDYLSGNVKEKLKQAQNAVANGFAEFNYNVEQLLDVIPSDIPAMHIEARLGSRWIPQEVYSQFAQELFNTPSARIIYQKSLDAYTNNGKIETVEATTKWGTSRRNGSDILLDALHINPPKIYDTLREFGLDKRVLNVEETKKAVEKYEDLRSEFENWVYKTEDRRNLLSRIYNDKYNTTIGRTYNGDHLNIAGINGITLRKHQKDAIWMLLQNNGGIIDHLVGAGKTYIMVAGTMEMKRTGIAKKPMIIALKSTIPQIIESYRQAYPMAKVLAPLEKDFTKENRKKLFSQIANNEWDVIIMSHENYGKIPHEADIQRQFIQDEMREVEEERAELEAQGEKMALKGLEIRLKNLEARLDKISDIDKDNTLTFEQMGIDHIMVDESQQFKNLSYVTKQRGVAGLSKAEGSKRAFNLFIGVRYLQKKYGADKGTTFLSGTPISNSMVEMYLLLKYLRPQKMAELGLNSFDAWATTFASPNSDIEFTVTGDFKAKTRFREFINVPELSMLYTEIADIRTDENTPLDKPKMKGGGYSVVDIKMSDDQIEYGKKLMEFAKTKDGKLIGVTMTKNQETAAMLLATNLSSKMAIDMRLINPSYDYDPNGKIAKLVDNVERIYNETNEHKGTQLIFSDLGTPKNKANKVATLRDYMEDELGTNLDTLNEIFGNPDESGYKYPSIWTVRERLETILELSPAEIDGIMYESANSEGAFNVYAEVRKRLVEKGIPEDQIVFIHDYNSQRAKEGLFKKVNEGEIRIVLGSTQKLGTGVNVQKRVVAVHHLDVPWTPASMEQRNGRAIRQGNLIVKQHYNNELPVYAYATERTLDAYKYQLLQTKQRFLDQVKSGNVEERTIRESDGDSESGVGYAELVAMLSGNKDILLKSKLEEKVQRLAKSKRNFLSEVYEAESKIKTIDERIPIIKENISRTERNVETITNTMKVDESGKMVVDDINGEKLQVVNDKGKTVPAERIDYAKQAIKLAKDKFDNLELIAGQSQTVKLFSMGGLNFYGFKRMEGGKINDLFQNIEKHYIQIIAPNGQEFSVTYSETAGILLNNIQKAIENIPAILSGQQAVLDKAIKDRKAYKEIIDNGGVWEKEQELQDSINELKEVTKRLDDSGEKPDTQDVIDENNLNEPEQSYKSGVTFDAQGVNERKNKYVTEKGEQLTFSFESFEESEPEAVSGTEMGTVSDGAGTNGALQREGDPTTWTQLDKLKPGETALVERVFTEQKSFDFLGGQSIKTVDDVVYIFKSLEDYAIENTFLVFIQDGKPTIIHAGMGAADQSVVDLMPAFVANHYMDADQIYIVHNHPSGSLEASPEDIAMIKKLRGAIGDKVQDGIIINLKSGKYAIFNEFTSWAETKTGINTDENPDVHPLKVYKFDKSVFDRDFDPEKGLGFIRNSHDIATFISSHRLGDRKKISYLLRNNAGNIVANLFTDVVNLSTDPNRLAEQIIFNASKFSGRQVVLFGDFRYTPLQAERLKLAIRQSSAGFIQLIDIITSNGNFTNGGLVKSAANDGVLEPQAKYGIEKPSEMDPLELAKRVSDRERMIAPNGKPSNLTPKQYEQVRTLEFKAWFGDWENNPNSASKVVDENGEPMVVYHGTKHNFTEFGKGQTGFFTKKLRTFYFTPSIDYAKTFGSKYGGVDMPVFLNIRKWKRVSNAVIEDVGYWANDKQLDEFEGDGYDGLVNYSKEQIVALNPSQIKSATSNNGQFDPNNNSIISEPEHTYGANGKPLLTEAEKMRNRLQKMVENRDEKIRKYKSDIAAIRKLMREDKANVKRSSDLIIKFAKDNVTPEVFDAMQKIEYNDILSAINSATRSQDLDLPFAKLTSIIDGIAVRRMDDILRKLLELKIVDQDGRGVSVAKNIDEHARVLMQKIKDRIDQMEFLPQSREMDDLVRQRKEVNELLKGTPFNEELIDQRKKLNRKIRQVEEARKAESRNLYPTFEQQIENQLNSLQNSEMNTQDRRDEAVTLHALKHIARILSIDADLFENEAEMNRVNSIKRGEEGYDTKRKQILTLETQKHALQIEKYWAIHHAIDRLGSIVENGRDSLIKWNEQVIERRKAINNEVIAAIKGKRDIKKLNEDRKDTAVDKVNAFFKAPLWSFDWALRHIDINHPAGKGPVYTRFMRSEEGISAANDNYVSGLHDYLDTIDKASMRIFGQPIKSVINASSKVFDNATIIEVQNKWEDAPRTIPVSMSKGQAMYVYMVWQMDDGRAHLMNQGYMESSMDEIVQFIGPKMVDFANWVQDEFLPQLRRDKYNPTHIKMFGTSMAERDHYFPIKIDNSSRMDAVELGEEYVGMPSTITGNIINRTSNRLPIDTEQNAFQVLERYGMAMEQWNAYAQVTQDLNGILGSRFIRNQMEANEKGSYHLFKDASAVAVRQFENRLDSRDRWQRSLAIALKRVATSKISFRLNTAIKQVLSLPAFLDYSTNPRFIAYLVSNMTTVTKDNEGLTNVFTWANNNLPSYKERVTSGFFGNEILQYEKSRSKVGQTIDRFATWGMLPNKSIDAYASAVGAKAVYDYAMHKYRKLDPEMASTLAKFDAEAVFNETQQSSEPAYLSPMQADGSILNRAITTYMNNNIAYYRKLVDGLDELAKDPAREIRTLESQYQSEGREDYKEKAKRDFYRAKATAIKRISMFGFGMQMLWAIGGIGIAGLFGDPDKKKKAAIRGALTGPLQGMPIVGDMAESLAYLIIKDADARPQSKFSMSPIMLVDEVTNGINNIITASSQYGLSPEVGKAVAKMVLTYGGVNAETFENIMIGAMSLANTGKIDTKTIGWLYIINLPESQRKEMAAKMFADMPQYEYTENILMAQKAMTTGWSRWMLYDSPRTQAEINRIGDAYNQKDWTIERDEEAEFNTVESEINAYKNKISKKELDPIGLASVIARYPGIAAMLKDEQYKEAAAKVGKYTKRYRDLENAYLEAREKGGSENESHFTHREDDGAEYTAQDYRQAVLKYKSMINDLYEKYGN